MRPIRAGVPQGSTLSPLLYSAYINDISRPLTGAQVALFADDMAELYTSPGPRASERASKFMKDASERFFDIANSHLNPLLVATVSYELPPPNHFCRRPRNVLLDPPDDLTVEVEKLLQLNKMAIE
ncbi:Probable RNA-directed DNA polymerase from transposon X-element [Eumeta japonica]|uniref:Probable RNA-directed DNA polymerase from transposon X-element n=1 Tax=Eumeta variegata TaxID=151549 RepID=A0A4C1ZGV8_EUMVA|nr:Probable RNA-directed DNA polymerase from transposon X-element [Eumeta japonica]